MKYCMMEKKMMFEDQNDILSVTALVSGMIIGFILVVGVILR